MAITRKCAGVVSCDFARLDNCEARRCDSFRLDGRDASMFDHFVQEVTEASGADVLYWHQNLEGSIRDPLYDEPIERRWQGPYKLRAYVEYIGAVPQMRDEGMVVRWEGRIWVARKSLESVGAPAPLEGDVFQYWAGDKFFDEHSVNAEHGLHGGYYFDVINVDDDGHVQDSGHFTGLVIQVLRRTDFTPERRLNEG